MELKQQFKEIKKRYGDFELSLLRKGKFPVKDTGLGYWGATPLSGLLEFFTKINLHQYNKFLDLGSGDGRVVLTASLFNIESHGIEADEELIDISLHYRRKLSTPLTDKTRFLNKNFFEHNINDYDIIYTSPDKPFFRDGFEKKLTSELRGLLIVHGWEFHPNNLNKVQEYITSGEKFTIYKN
ncbi:MAG: class I SAM-dependent methyltransferase [Nanobdellota archaeon]